MHNDMDQTAVLVFWIILTNTGDENTINCKKLLLRSLNLYIDQIRTDVSRQIFSHTLYLCNL
jgi:hypothetical protein